MMSFVDNLKNKLAREQAAQPSGGLSMASTGLEDSGTDLSVAPT